MVYIYKKAIGNKNYYYLRASKREKGKQITKEIAYLGKTIEEARENFPKIAKDKQEIKKAYRRISLFLETEYYTDKAKKLKLKKDNFLDGNLIEVEAIRLHFKKVFKKLNEKTQKEILEIFSIDYTYNTTSLEGNTITLEEAKNFFEEGKTPADRTLRELHDLKNTKSTLFWLIGSKVEINEKLILEIHGKLMENIDNRLGYRTRDNKVFRSRFNTSPGIYVKTDMDLILEWYEEHKSKLHPLVLASIFHHKFEKVHPFMDGNGRTGRMLMNYILIRSGYPPLVIYKKHRGDYLDALGSVDKINLTKTDIGYKKLVNYISSEAIESYWDLFL